VRVDETIKGVILCSGLGSRLRPLSYYIPKSMVPIGRDEKPLLEWILRLMAYRGIGDVVLLIGYKGLRPEYGPPRLGDIRKSRADRRRASESR